MKPIKSKAQIRRELAREVEEFLLAGGAVTSVPQGESGNENNKNIFSHNSSFEPRQTRTPLNDVVLELEGRKASKSPEPKSSAGPKKKLITDDFGEPVRWVWTDKK